MKKLIVVLICLQFKLLFADVVKINAQVYEKIKLHGHADVFFVLNEKANYSGAEKIIDRTQRIQFVYDKLRQTALKSQIEVIKTIKSEQLEYRSFYLINAVSVESANLEQINKISALPSVKSVELDVQAKFKTAETVYDIFESINPSEVTANFKQIGVDKVWNDGIMGEGIVIAGQDTGYKWDHPALKTQYRGYSPFSLNHDYNWHDAIRKKSSQVEALSSCGYNTAAPCDDQGHGTHTMGTMVGYDWLKKTNRIGVAPKAKWIGCRNMDQGVGKASTYLECFEFFLAPYPRGGNAKIDGDPAFAPHLINNSWACPKNEGCNGDEFIDAIDAIQAAGIVVVASAGNEGPSCGSVGDAPGTYSGKLFSVAAYDHRNGEIAGFSSRGPSKWNGGVGPNITAPGSGIRSAVPSGGLGEGGFYDYKSGTSMSGPHVAGVIALIWSAQPSLIGNITGTMSLIEKTATAKTSSQSCGAYVGSKIPNAVFGYGIIDADLAVKTAKQNF